MRRRSAAVSLLGAVALACALAGCGDDGDPIASGSGGDTCADLAVAVIDPVVEPDLDDPPEGGLSDAEDVESEEEAAAALDRLAADGPEEVAVDATALLETYEVEEDEVTDDLVVEARAAGERLIAWAAGSCEIEGPVWSCPVRSTFRTVGAAIDDGSEEVLPPSNGTPEEVVAGSAAVGERVEVSRADDRVLFAWLDDDGLVVRSEMVTRDDGGDWSAVETSECDAGESTTPADEGAPFEAEGEPALPEPPDEGVATSVP